MNLDEFDKLIVNLSFQTYYEIRIMKVLVGRDDGLNGVWRKVGRTMASRIEDQIRSNNYKCPKRLEVSERILKELEGSK
jgi:hypothetical protein